MADTRKIKERYLIWIDEWLKSISERTGVNHTYQEDFNVYRLIVNKDGVKKVASCDYNRIKDFCNFINNLWVYYMAMN